MRLFKIITITIISLLLVIIVSSCSSPGGGSSSKNFVKKGTFYLVGGRFEQLQWQDKLSFKRVSWYHELTLLFDMMLSEWKGDSKFSYWLSPAEQDIVERCHRFYLLLSYATDSGDINHAMFNQIMKNNGLNLIEMPNFRTSLRLHPDFASNSLRHYQVHGLCQKNPIPKSDRKIVLPSFAPVNF